MSNQTARFLLDPNDPNDYLRFDLLYQGFVGGGNESKESGLAILGTRVGVLKALRAISHDTSPGIRRLASLQEGIRHSLVFEEDELEMLTRYLGQCSWRVELSEAAVDVIEWLKRPLPNVGSPT